MVLLIHTPNERSTRLIQLKMDSLLRAFAAYKKAEKEGTLVKVPLTDEQRKIIQ